MVKTSEPALKIVMRNKRKWLTRLNQTVTEVGAASRPYALVTQDLPVNSRHLTRRTFAGGTWKPRIAPLGDSRLQGLPMAVRAQERGKSECPAVMDGIRVAISPDAKAGRLPHGLSSPESF
jgi:hypothetical protein